MLTMKEQEIKKEELQQEIRNIEKEIERTTSETKKEYLLVVLKEKKEELEELYFEPTYEDYKEYFYYSL